MSSIVDTLIQSEYLDELTSFILGASIADAQDNLFELTGYSWSTAWGTSDSMPDVVQTILKLARQAGDRPVAYSKATYVHRSRSTPLGGQEINVHLYFLHPLDIAVFEVELIAMRVIAEKGVNASLTSPNDAIRKLATKMHLESKNFTVEE